jgi:hypothetical protein
MTDRRKLSFLLSGFLVLALLIPTVGLITPVSASPDAGDSWTTPQNVTMLNMPSYPAASDRGIAVDSAGNVHLVYESNDDTGVTAFEIFYVTNLAGSWTWTNISKNTQNSAHQRHPVIAIDSNNIVHIVWNGFTASGDVDIFYANNSGGTWTNPYNITQTGSATDLYHPTLVIDPLNNLHVAYKDVTNDIVCYTTKPAGGDWVTPTNITTPGIFDEITNGLSIDYDSGNNIYVAFSANMTTDYAIYLVNNTGGTWSTPINTSTDSFATNEVPSMDIDSGNNIHLVWEYNDHSHQGIIYQSYISGSWGPEIFVNATAEATQGATIKADSAYHAHIVYAQRDPSTNELFYVNNTQGSFGSPVDITQTASTAQYTPHITIDNRGYVHLMYRDGPGPFVIRYTHTTEPVAAPVGGDLTLVIIVVAVVVVVVIGAAFYLLRIRKPK